MERYIVERSLGHGQFGVVSVVRSIDDSQLYVMKQIDLQRLDPPIRAAALNEAQLLSDLKHPCIVGYKESILLHNEETLCIFMEFCEGGDMQQLIAKQRKKTKIEKIIGKGGKIKNIEVPIPFEENVILDYFIQLTLSLKYIHSLHILHRDLKAQNVFLTSSNTLKLGDFGISRVLSNEDELAATVIGSPYGMSPEICEGRNYGKKSDIWSLGCVLYELCTLKHAFNGKNLPALVLKILKGEYPTIPSIYSSSLSSLIDCLLQQNPNARPSINQILRMKFIRDRLKVLKQQRVDIKLWWKLNKKKWKLKMKGKEIKNEQEMISANNTLATGVAAAVGLKDITSDTDDSGDDDDDEEEDDEEEEEDDDEATDDIDATVDAAEESSVLSLSGKHEKPAEVKDWFRRMDAQYNELFDNIQQEKVAGLFSPKSKGQQQGQQSDDFNLGPPSSASSAYSSLVVSTRSPAPSSLPSQHSVLSPRSPLPPPHTSSTKNSNSKQSRLSNPPHSPNQIRPVPSSNPSPASSSSSSSTSSSASVTPSTLSPPLSSVSNPRSPTVKSTNKKNKSPSIRPTAVGGGKNGSSGTGQRTSQQAEFEARMKIAEEQRVLHQQQQNQNQPSSLPIPSSSHSPFLSPSVSPSASDSFDSALIVNNSNNSNAPVRGSLQAGRKSVGGVASHKSGSNSAMKPKARLSVGGKKNSGGSENGVGGVVGSSIVELPQQQPPLSSMHVLAALEQQQLQIEAKLKAARRRSDSVVNHNSNQQSNKSGTKRPINNPPSQPPQLQSSISTPGTASGSSSDSTVSSSNQPPIRRALSSDFTSSTPPSSSPLQQLKLELVNQKNRAKEYKKERAEKKAAEQKAEKERIQKHKASLKHIKARITVERKNGNKTPNSILEDQEPEVPVITTEEEEVEDTLPRMQHLQVGIVTNNSGNSIDDILSTSQRSIGSSHSNSSEFGSGDGSPNSARSHSSVASNGSARGKKIQQGVLAPLPHKRAQSEHKQEEASSHGNGNAVGSRQSMGLPSSAPRSVTKSKSSGSSGKSRLSGGKGLKQQQRPVPRLTPMSSSPASSSSVPSSVTRSRPTAVSEINSFPSSNISNSVYLTEEEKQNAIIESKAKQLQRANEAAVLKQQRHEQIKAFIGQFTKNNKKKGNKKKEIEFELVLPAYMQEQQQQQLEKEQEEKLILKSIELQKSEIPPSSIPAPLIIPSASPIPSSNSNSAVPSPRILTPSGFSALPPRHSPLNRQPTPPLSTSTTKPVIPLPSPPVSLPRMPSLVPSVSEPGSAKSVYEVVFAPASGRAITGSSAESSDSEFVGGREGKEEIAAAAAIGAERAQQQIAAAALLNQVIETGRRTPLAAARSPSPSPSASSNSIPASSSSAASSNSTKNSRPVSPSLTPSSASPASGILPPPASHSLFPPVRSASPAPVPVLSPTQSQSTTVSSSSSSNSPLFPPATSSSSSSSSSSRFVSDRDARLSHQIESSRELCEQLLGEELFMKCYAAVRKIAELEELDTIEAERLDATVQSWLQPNQIKAMKHIHRLIYCEDLFY